MSSTKINSYVNKVIKCITKDDIENILVCKSINAKINSKKFNAGDVLTEVLKKASEEKQCAKDILNVIDKKVGDRGWGSPDFLADKVFKHFFASEYQKIIRGKNIQLINVYLRKCFHYRQPIRSKRYNELDFDEDKLSCMDVNLTVIEQFKHCKNLKELEGYEDLPQEIKELDTKKSIECIDLLGVYIAPTKNDKANILLSKEKIEDVAKKYLIDIECLYNFVKIHEYAHASMCPILANKNCKINKRTALYTLIEESLATAVALKKMKNTTEYSKLEKFVTNQPLQYRYGLKLITEFEKDIEEMMICWKKYKSGDRCYENKEFYEDSTGDWPYSYFYYILNDVIFIPKVAREIFFLS